MIKFAFAVLDGVLSRRFCVQRVRLLGSVLRLLLPGSGRDAVHLVLFFIICFYLPVCSFQIIDYVAILSLSCIMRIIRLLLQGCGRDAMHFLVCLVLTLSLNELVLTLFIIRICFVLISFAVMFFLRPFASFNVRTASRVPEFFEAVVFLLPLYIRYII